MENTRYYLIYHSNQDPYEGRDSPFSIVKSEKRAKEIIGEIIKYGKSLAEQMLYPYQAGISNDEFIFRDKSNLKLLNGSWPHGWEANNYSDFEYSRHCEDGELQGMEFDENTVAYQELPFLK